MEISETSAKIWVATLGNTKVKDQYDECLEALKGKTVNISYSTDLAHSYDNMLKS